MKAVPRSFLVSIVLCVVVLVALGVTARQPLLEQYWLWKLEDEHLESRHEALRRLCDVAGQRAVPRIVEAVESLCQPAPLDAERLGLLKDAGEALARLGPRSLPRLAAAIPVASIRRRPAKSDFPSRVTPELFFDAWVTSVIEAALARSGAEVLALLNDPRPPVRALVGRALADLYRVARESPREPPGFMTFGEPRPGFPEVSLEGAAHVVPGLIAELDSSNHHVRFNAAWLLGEVGPTAAPAIDSLLRVLAASRHRQSARACRHGLIGIGEAVVPSVLRSTRQATDYVFLQDCGEVLAALGDGAVPQVIGALRSGVRGERICAAAALAYRREIPATALRAVGEVLPELEIFEAFRLATLLRRMAPESAPAVPGLTRLLSHPDTRVRHCAATTLEEIGAPARAAVPALRAMAATDDSGHADSALRAILKPLDSAPGRSVHTERPQLRGGGD